MRRPSTYMRSVCVWLVLACAALAQAPAKTPAKPVVTSTSEADLPEAPAAQHALLPPQLTLIEPAARPRAAPPHRFFDKTNLWLHTGAIMAETADLISTHRAIQAGAVEANPLARPLVRKGLAGQIASAYGMGEGALLLTSYIFHRTGHHRLERLVPVFAIPVEGLATVSNIRTRDTLKR